MHALSFLLLRRRIRIRSSKRCGNTVCCVVCSKTPATHAAAAGICNSSQWSVWLLASKAAADHAAVFALALMHTQDPLKYGWDNYGYSEDGYSYEKHYPKASYGKDRYKGDPYKGDGSYPKNTHRKYGQDSPYSKGTDTPYSKDGEWAALVVWQTAHTCSPGAMTAVSKCYTVLASVITCECVQTGQLSLDACIILPACSLLRCAGTHKVDAMTSLEGAQESVPAQQP